MKHTINILVENEFGVLTRIAGLFSGRGYNIQSLTVAETSDPSVSIMTIVTSGNAEVIEQIVKQLNKQVNIIKVKNLTDSKAITRRLALIKVSLNQKNRNELLKTIELSKASIADLQEKCCIVEVVGNDQEISSAFNLLKPFGIIEFIQSGKIAMQRGKKILDDIKEK